METLQRVRKVLGGEAEEWLVQRSVFHLSQVEKRMGRSDCLEAVDSASICQTGEASIAIKRMDDEHICEAKGHAAEADGRFSHEAEAKSQSSEKRERSDRQSDDCTQGEGKQDVAGRMGSQVRDCGQKSSPKVATPKQLMTLLEMQGFACALSGRPLTVQTASIDHIHCRQESSDDSITNLQWIHAEINAAKNTMSVDQFVAMCREVAAFSNRE